MTKEITALQSPLNFHTQRLPSAAGENDQGHSRLLFLPPAPGFDINTPFGPFVEPAADEVDAFVQCAALKF